MNTKNKHYDYLLKRRTMTSEDLFGEIHTIYRWIVCKVTFHSQNLFGIWANSALSPTVEFYENAFLCQNKKHAQRLEKLYNNQEWNKETWREAQYRFWDDNKTLTTGQLLKLKEKMIADGTMEKYRKFVPPYKR